MNESSGLYPSEYAGGGSLSSPFWFEDSPLTSCGSARLVSATVSSNEPDLSRGLSDAEGEGAYAGAAVADDAPASKEGLQIVGGSLKWSSTVYRLENGGGAGREAPRENEVEAEASEAE